MGPVHLLFFLLLITSSAFAQKQCGDSQSIIEDIIKHIDTPVTDDDVTKAPCRGSTVYDETFYDKQIQAITQRSPERVSISTSSGYSFTDESPDLIQLFRAITEPEKGSLYERKPALSVKLNPNCHKVACALETVFRSPTLGKRLMYLVDRYHVNASHFAYENSIETNPYSLDLITKSLEAMPSWFFPLEPGSNKKMTLAPNNSADDELGETSANASITLFPHWKDQSVSQRQVTLVHEMGHVMGTKLKQLDETPAWLNLSSWENKDGEWSKDENAMVSTYGATNPAEDFAETFMMYRYNPSMLKTLHPEKFNFMKSNVFLGVQYDSPDHCAPSTSTLASLANGQTPPAVIPLNDWAKCAQYIYNVIDIDVRANEKIALKRCLQNNMGSILANQNAQSIHDPLVLNAIQHAGEFPSSTSLNDAQLDAYVSTILQKNISFMAKAFLSEMSLVQDISVCKKVSSYIGTSMDSTYKPLFGDLATYAHSDNFAPIFKTICEQSFKDKTHSTKQWWWENHIKALIAPVAKRP